MRQRKVSGCQLTGVLLLHHSQSDPRGSAPSGNTLTMFVDGCHCLVATWLQPLCTGEEVLSVSELALSYEHMPGHTDGPDARSLFAV